MFLDFPTDNDKELVADYLVVCIKQDNTAVKTKRVYIVALAYLCRYLGNKKSLRDITAKDLAAYLDSLRKSQEEQPDQGWISTQHTYGSVFEKFFKWLAYPDLVPQERKHLPREKLSAVLKGPLLQQRRDPKALSKLKTYGMIKTVLSF